MAPKCQSQLLFGKTNQQDVLKTYRTKLDQVWCINSQTTKAWMRTEIMGNSLGLLDQKLRLEGRKVIHFLDNAPCYPKKLQNNLANIKLIFLPKYTSSRLQPRDVDIVRAFKCKYRKLFMKYVVSRIDGGNYTGC